MNVKFFLYANNRSALEEELRKTGYSLEFFENHFAELTEPGLPDVDRETADGQINNPWITQVKDGSPVLVEKPQGYGRAFFGDESAVADVLNAFREEKTDHVIGLDFVPASAAPAATHEHWRPGAASFGTRDQAERLIEAGALGAAGLTGENVNVVIVDQGISAEYIQALGGSYGGGIAWPVATPFQLPGQVDVPYVKRRREHGNLIARTVLALAPNAKLFDAPIIPPRIADVLVYALVATAAYYSLMASILHWLRTGVATGPFVIVNPWGIFDRRQEWLLGAYTENHSHPLNQAVNLMTASHDVVFAAGNCGQFAPDRRCGPYDRGPGRSIWGANALDRVITVGATRTDARWVGASAQGPGPGALGPIDVINEKPDFCAPSWFCEVSDAALVSSGTSTACAVAAGVTAALRQGWDPVAVTPAAMKDALRASARKFGHLGWNDRFGEGVLNVPGAINRLSGQNS